MTTLSNLISFRSLQKDPRHGRMCLVVERHVSPRQMESAIEVGRQQQLSQTEKPKKAIQQIDQNGALSGSEDFRRATLM